jgi:hypothetical protein
MIELAVEIEEKKGFPRVKELLDSLAKWQYNKHIDKQGADMPYTLITKQGKIMQFYVRSVADLYCSLNGGVVITQQILVDTADEIQYN